MAIIDLQTNNTNIVKTASQWANNTDIYTDKFILYVSDEFYGSTNQTKFKKANGVKTFNELDFMPISEGSTVTNVTNNTINGADLSPMDKPKKVIEDSAFHKRNINYIISGDSLRGRASYTDIFDYARALLSQLNINEVILNATPSLTSSEWVANTNSEAKMQDAIDASLGVDGVDTIIEMSFGFNDVLFSAWVVDDFVTADFTTAKQTYKSNIQALLTAKPSINILLVSPNATTKPVYDALMQTMISEIADELELPYVDMVRGFENIRPATTQSNKDNAYYTDSIHVNDNGGRRIYNWILNNITPDSLRFKVNMFDFPTIATPQPYNPTPVILASGWRNDFASGELRLNNVTTWRCFSKVNVYEDQCYKLKFDTAVNGNVAEIRWVYPNNVMVKQILSGLPKTLNSTKDYWTIIVPKGAISMHVTISLDGTAYDASNDVPELYLFYTKNDYVMTLEDINRPLNIFLNNN